MLPVLPGGGGGAAPARTAGDLRSELYPYLGAIDAAGLEFWTEAELLAWLNSGFERLARKTGVFVERDATTTVTGGNPSYPLPTRHLSTIHVSLGTVRLRAANRAELEARDVSWKTSAATPSHYLQDHGAGLASIRLYKKPVASGTLAIVQHVTPTALAAGDPLPLPDPLADYAFFVALAEARRRESDAAMPEVAAFCDELLGLYEHVCREYWGIPQ